MKSSKDGGDGNHSSNNIVPGPKSASLLQRLLLLLWKNLLFRRRHYVVTTFEILLPTLCAFIVAFAKTWMIDSKSTVEKNNTVYSPTSSYEYYSFTSIELLCANCILGYTPVTNRTTEIMERLRTNFNDSYPNYDPDYDYIVRPFDSEEEMGRYLAASDFLDNIDPPLKVGIVFNDVGDGSVTYTLRPASYTIHTDTIFSWLQLPGPELENSASYLNGGVAGLQIALDKTLIELMTSPEDKLDEPALRAFPYPPYFKGESFSQFYFLIFPQLFVVGFIFIVPSVIRNTVSERDSGIKELMKLMGLPNWLHWIGWILNSVIILSISISIVMFLMFFPFNPDAGPVVSFGAISVWWVVFFLYALAASCFCFFISVWTTKVTMAITAGIVLWIISYYPLFVTLDLQSYRSLPLHSKLLAALSPNMGLHWAMKVMCSFEGKGVGSQWHNIHQPISLFDEMSLLQICIMFVIDIFLYLILTLYFENILPSKFGVRKPVWYIFQASTWFNKKRRNPKSRSNSLAPSTHQQPKKPGYEADPPNIRPTIQIQNLVKRFGSKTAVNNLTLNIYESQITAFLGHNGAGKTTTISILTGLFAATEGNAWINGYSIEDEMELVRKDLGLCPQFNMLFDRLTVWEHLVFFGRIKGKSGSEAKSEAKTLIKKLQLTEKTHTMSMDLSGGQKRKLCLGMALIGGTKIIILDEPTSGMDPEARRVIWDLLLEIRSNRTILLTTHFMEEADILGDRVVIMADGGIQCVGSGLFLKRCYGTGSTLKLATTLTPNTAEIIQLVQKHIPSAYVKREQPPTVDISLGNTESENCVRLFNELSLYENEFGIIAKGLSPTTMDEVFLHIGDMQEKKKEPMTNGTNNHQIEPEEQIEPYEKLTSFRFTISRFVALLKKKMIYSSRQKLLLILQFIVPPILLIFAILLSSKTFTPAKSSPALKMDLTPYKLPKVIYSGNNTLAEIYQNLLGSIAKPVEDMIEALLHIALTDLGSYREQYLFGADLNNLTAYYSTSPHHSVPLSINYITNTILHQFSSTGSINAIVHPLENELSSILEAAQPNPAYTILVPIIYGALVPIALALFGSTFMVFPTDERVSKAKQLQLMSGVSILTFWVSSFLWDLMITLIAIGVLLACFPLFESYGSYSTGDAIWIMFLILFVWSFSAIMFSYCFSLFVPNSHGGYAAQAVVHILTGLLLPIVVFLLGSTAPTVSVIIRAFGSIFPTFGASMSIMRFASIATANGRCNIIPDDYKELFCKDDIEVDSQLLQCCDNCAIVNNKSYIEPPHCFVQAPFLTWSHYEENIEYFGIGRELTYLSLCGLFYLILLIVIESGFYKMLLTKKRPVFLENYVTDEDVLNEANKIPSWKNDSLLVQSLYKSFGRFVAVNNLNFIVGNGECFGLLGVNGAGKTTTFRILTGDEEYTFGNILLKNPNEPGGFLNLRRDPKKFLAKIGYCPQFDAIIGVLTGREMLQLFGRLRGVPNGEILDKEVSRWLNKLGLLQSGNVECGKYSGGMKRRLSVAMAMIGDPDLIFLDEPTSGVDPVARRQFWNVIASLRQQPNQLQKKQSIILTSHSMEECESLCSRLGIMVNGQLQCLGSVQHLKSKYAIGYSLVLQLSIGIEVEMIKQVKEEVLRSFEACRVQDEHQNVLQFQILSKNYSWETLFQQVEQLKTDYATEIDDYLLSETSLEQVFLNFARQQYPNRYGGGGGQRRNVKEHLKRVLLIGNNGYQVNKISNGSSSTGEDEIDAVLP